MRAATIVIVILTIVRVSFSSSERGVEEVEPLLLSILKLANWKDAGDKGFSRLNSGKYSELTNSRKSLSCQKF